MVVVVISCVGPLSCATEHAGKIPLSGIRMMTGGAGGSGSLGSGQRLRLVLGVKEGPVSTFDPPKLKIKVVHLMISPTKKIMSLEY